MDKWISVNDRLPEVGRQKSHKLKWLVFDGEQIYIESLHPDWWNNGMPSGDFITITHWQPLPEPPE